MLFKDCIGPVHVEQIRRAGKLAEKSFRIFAAVQGTNGLMAAWTPVVALEVLKRG